jgi:predicted nucleic acid-binding protein
MMIYFDTSYLARLYVGDPGWEKVRALARSDRIACALHGKAEAIAAFHRKFREGTISQSAFAGLLSQFESDCATNAFEWLPLTNNVLARVNNGYATLPATAHLRAADALHLACAAEGGFKELYSNDAHLLSGAQFFALKGVNII